MAPWKGRVNAEVYDRFVREFQVYRSLNARLVALARMGEARRVLDLACGTGATTLACLRVLDFDAEVVGVDASEDMVEVARANVLDPRARFLTSPAASVDRVAPGPFDRVLCNAAFWQFPAPRPVLGAVARVLSPGGLLAFNVPAERVTGAGAPVHPFQAALARAVEARTGRAFPPPAAPLDPAVLDRMLAEEGFEPAVTETFPYRVRQGELMRLMGIPAMIRPLVPGFSPEEREAVLREAMGRADPELQVEVPWVYFAARRRAEASAPAGGE